MGKKKRVRAAAELDLARGSAKKFEKKESKAGKIVAIVAAILAVVLVLGVFAAEYIPGLIQKNMKTVESDNYKITQPMLTYFFNQSYQSYVSSYQQYLSYTGLDVTKALKDQTTPDGQTWYDYFMSGTVDSVKQLLVLCEAAKADDTFDMDDEVEAEVNEAVEALKSQATSYNVSFDYYLKAVYGSGVTEKVLRQCMKLSELASHYSQELQSRHEYTEADWDKYYEDNKDTFRKADYLTYTFSVTATTVGDDATEEEKEAAAAADKAEAERMKGLAAELAATTDKEAFCSYVENYLKTDKYKDMDEEALKEDNVDINALVEGCLKEGNTYSDSDLNNWLFDDARKGYETYTEDEDDSYTVYMILPAEGSDIGSACLYRDAYALKNFRYIPALTEDFENEEAAKTFAESVMEEYKKDATEDNFAALAAEDKYGDGNYEGGLVEKADKGVIGDEVDAWLYDSARKAGDCEVIGVADKGYYVVYYCGDDMMKWQATADNGLLSADYEKDFKALEEKFAVTVNTDATKYVKEVDLSSAADTSAAN